jgi:hypothetical protein
LALFPGIQAWLELRAMTNSQHCVLMIFSTDAVGKPRTCRESRAGRRSDGHGFRVQGSQSANPAIAFRR